MATYSFSVVAPTWQDRIGFPGLAIDSISSSRVQIRNDDGSLTILAGSGFSGSAGNPGILTAGSISSMTYMNASGLTQYAKITGLSYPATSFINATSGDSLFDVLLSGNDTYSGTGSNDNFLSSPGGDTFNGSGGADTVSYERSLVGASVDFLNGTAAGGSCPTAWCSWR